MTLYNLSYENLEYPDYDGFLPDSQPLCEGLDINTAFAVAAELSAEAWLADGTIGYESDGSYTVQPQID